MNLMAIPALKFKQIKGLFKVLLIMKIMLLLMLAFVAQAFATGNAQVVSLSENNTPPKSVLAKIESQTGYYFWYENTLIDKIGPISVKFKKLPLKDALNLCFANQPVTYEIINRTILLKPGMIIETFREITGIVRDSGGTLLGGATIAVKGTKKQAISDANGRFSIEATDGDILVVTFVGYESTEVLINTSQKNVDIVLQKTTRENENIVVTALGIRRAERSLTYQVQEFKSEEVTRNKDANFVNSLTGKIAGVTINSSSSGIGGATRVVMRGTKSISQSNNVLYVIDGMPIPNPSGGENTTGPFNGLASGEGISSINPEDIESISALTGPTASALYGSRGQNGVILVTTKKGQTGKISVNISHSTDFFRPFVLPDFQNTYGPTNEGSMMSWGPKLETPSTYEPKDFFQTGNNIFNAITLSGGTEKNQTLFSVATNNANGIIPNNTYNRHNFYLRQSTSFTDRLSTDFSGMFVNADDNNMMAQGQYFNPLLGAYLFPPGDDIRKYELYQRYDPDKKVPLQFWPFGNQGLSIENPYWVAYAESNKNKSNRYMLSATAKYKLLNWLDIVGRARIDNTSGTYTEKRPAGTDGQFASQYGFYRVTKINIKSTYADIMATIRKRLLPDLNFQSNIGGSFTNMRSDKITGGGNLILVSNFFNITENTNTPATEGYGPIRDYQEQAVFATAEFDYKKWLFLNATGRQEWSSALAGANKKSYFYPSLGLSGVLTDVFKLPRNVLSFAKVRLSYAEVGNAPPPGITNPTYSLTNENFRPAPFPEFLPERSRSLEAGMELKFLKNTITFNATVYKSNTTNQLLNYQSLTGGLYTNYYYNAGDIENKGIEATLGYNSNWRNFSWNSSLVFTLNRNKIKRLSEGYINPVTGEVFGKDSIRNGTVGGDLLNILAVGGSMADLYITQRLREDNQGHLYDPSGSGPQKINIPATYIGQTNPDYTIGWRNSFTYKNFDLSFLVDARVGGIGISYTQSIMDFFGVSQKTADERDNGGVEIYGKIYPNVEKFYNALGGASGAQVGMAAYYIYSATNIRLREAALGYTIPGTWFNGKINSIRVGITGRNLIMFYNKSPFDPESTSSTGTYYQGIDYFRQPSYRSFGFSLRAQF